MTAKIKILLGVALLFSSWLVEPAMRLAAAEGSLAVSSSVSVNQAGSARVKHIFSFKAMTSLPEQAELTLLDGQIKGLTAQEEDKAKLKTALSEDGQRLAVEIPAERRAKSGTWSFSIEYSTSPLGDLGSVKALQVPALDSNLAVTKHSLRVAADLDLGFASVRGPTPAKTSVSIGQQILDFADKNSQVEDSILVVFGKSTTAKVTVATTLKNNSWWWKEIALTLPPDTNQQRVMLASLEPQPANVRLDRDGNILAIYRIGPLGQKEVTAKVDVSVTGLNYNLDEAGNVDQTDPQLVERYTKQTSNWKAQGFEIEIAQGANSAEVAEAVYKGVVERIKAEEGNLDQLLQVRDRTPPLKYADWLVGELRSRGVPARVVLGLVYTDGEHLIEDPRPSAWVEANVAGVGWITLDPWLGAHNGEFGSADPLHVALGLWGLEDDRPPVPVDSASVVFSEDAVEASAEPTPGVKAVKHVVLPFFSVLQVSINSGQPVIVDNVASKIKDELRLVGSIAPGGWASQRLPVFGPRAFNSEPVQAGQMNGDEFVQWVETATTTSYLPLIIIIGLLLVGWITWRWLGRRRADRRRFKPSKESLMLHEEATGGEVESENLVSAPAQVEDLNITDTSEPDNQPHRDLVQ